MSKFDCLRHYGRGSLAVCEVRNESLIDLHNIEGNIHEIAKGRVLKAIESEQSPEFFELGNNSQSAVSRPERMRIPLLLGIILGFSIGKA